MLSLYFFGINSRILVFFFNSYSLHTILVISNAFNSKKGGKLFSVNMKMNQPFELMQHLIPAKNIFISADYSHTTLHSSSPHMLPEPYRINMG